MQPNSNEAGQYKALLPAHMRQGIPPYLQVLFAARPKLPYLPPINKPHHLRMVGFFSNIDYNHMKRESDSTKLARSELKAEIPKASEKTFHEAIVQSTKSKQWRQKLAEHIERQKTEYRQWLEERDKTVGNRSYEPKNTLIVTRLVFS